MTKDFSAKSDKVVVKLLACVALLLTIVAIVLEIYPKAMVRVRMITPQQKSMVYGSYFSMTIMWTVSYFPMLTAVSTSLFAALQGIVLFSKKEIRTITFTAVLVPGIVAFVCSVLSAFVWTDNYMKYLIVMVLLMGTVFFAVNRIVTKRA